MRYSFMYRVKLAGSTLSATGKMPCLMVELRPAFGAPSVLATNGVWAIE
jgi:hypothetical protein